MKIDSAAGEFDFDIEDLKIVGRDIVIVGKMGVWEAETVMTQADMLKMLRLTFGRPAFWLYMLKLPFFALFGRKSASGETAT